MKKKVKMEEEKKAVNRHRETVGVKVSFSMCIRRGQPATSAAFLEILAWRTEDNRWTLMAVLALLVKASSWFIFEVSKQAQAVVIAGKAGKLGISADLVGDGRKRH